MKKLVSLLAALVILSNGIVAFAANSSTASDLAKNVTATSSTGATVTIEAVSETVKEEAVSAAVQNKANSNVLALMEVSVEETGSATITFDVAGVKAGANIYVLHYNGTKWEVIHPDKVEDGKVTATFTSLSPVAIVEIPTAETLPKTGATVVLPVMAVICAAGAVVFGKKAKKN